MIYEGWTDELLGSPVGEGASWAFREGQLSRAAIIEHSNGRFVPNKAGRVEAGQQSGPMVQRMSSAVIQSGRFRPPTIRTSVTARLGSTKNQTWWTDLMMLPERRPYVRLAALIVSIGLLSIAAVLFGLLAWNLTIGWF